MDDLDLRPTEDRLRAGLRARAARIDPPDRYDDVLEAARSRGGARRWVPLAAAAAVAAVVGGLWVAQPDPRDPRPTSVAGTSSPTPSTTPSTSASPSATPSTSASASPSPTSTTSAPTGAASALPVYVVSPEVTAAPDGRYGLRREWRPTTTRDETARVREAVDATLDSAPGDLDRWPWADVDVRDVQVGPGAVVVTVSAAPTPSGTAADDLLLPAVGWTAQAVLGRGNLPVTVRTADRTLGVVTRPAADETWSVLADIWVTAPLPGARLDADRPVVVRGEASAFEAALTWELTSGGARVDSGFVTASAGAPARGSYEIDLGRLDPGTYTVRVLERSAADGSDAADAVATFTVR